MAEIIPLAKPGPEEAATGGFVMTDGARNIMRSIHMVAQEFGGAITLIAAAPGTGKTEALWHYKNSFRDQAVLYTAVAKEDDTPWGVASNLTETLEINKPNSRDMRGTRQRIAQAIGTDRVLLVDEAQNLICRNTRGGTDWSTLEWLRFMSEEGAFSLVFAGDLALLETETKAPQLWRRMRRRVIMRTVGRSDVAAVAAAHGVGSDDCADLLYLVAKRYGGLADVVNAISHAKLLGGGRAAESSVLLAALEDLKLLPKGGA